MSFVLTTFGFMPNWGQKLEKKLSFFDYRYHLGSLDYFFARVTRQGSPDLTLLTVTNRYGFSGLHRVQVDSYLNLKGSVQKITLVFWSS